MQVRVDLLDSKNRSNGSAGDVRINLTAWAHKRHLAPPYDALLLLTTNVDP